MNLGWRGQSGVGRCRDRVRVVQESHLLAAFRESVVFQKPGQESVRRTCGLRLWDDEIDGRPAKSSPDPPTGIVSARWWAAIGAGGSLLAFIFFLGAVIVRETAHDREFWDKL